MIDSFVHGKQAVLSFRQLSTLSNIPLREARQKLSNYAAKASDITILYHVSDKTKKTLTTTKPTAGRVKVWAVAPKAISLSPSVWMNGDRENMLQEAAEPSNQPNALRDGRYLPIHSVSAAWDTRMDPRFGGQQPPSSGSGLNSRKPSGLLGAVKAHQKRGSSASINGKAKRAKTGLTVNGSVRESVNKTSGKSSSGSQGSQQQQPKSLFSTKRLGQDAANRMKAKNKTPMVRKNVKKRRVTCDDDDDDDDSDMKNNGLDMMDVDDDVDSDVERERRALERERKEADERAEVEQELQNLSNEVIDEPESPEMKEVDEDAVVEQELGMKNKGGEKRSFRESFGLPPEQANGSRRIRKEVEVTVEENGYLVTRRVMKTFDEHGNEVESPKTNDSDKENDKENDEKAAPASCIPSILPSTPKAKRPNTPAKEQKAQSSSTTGTFSKTKSQKGNTSKKPKKSKANIMSYFKK